MFRVTCFFNFETDIPATTSLFAGCSNCNLGRGKYIFRELFLGAWTQNCKLAWFYLWRLLPLDGFRLFGLSRKIFTRSPVVVVAGPGLGNRLNDLLLEEQISSNLHIIYPFERLLEINMKRHFNHKEFVRCPCHLIPLSTANMWTCCKHNNDHHRCLSHLSLLHPCIGSIGSIVWVVGIVRALLRFKRCVRKVVLVVDWAEMNIVWFSISNECWNGKAMEKERFANRKTFSSE